jgi:hypothetical protein
MMGKNCLKFLSIDAVITEQKTESLFIPHAGPRVQMHISLIYFINDSRLEISSYFAYLELCYWMGTNGHKAIS